MATAMPKNTYRRSMFWNHSRMLNSAHPSPPRWLRSMPRMTRRPVATAPIAAPTKMARRAAVFGTSMIQFMTLGRYSPMTGMLSPSGTRAIITMTAAHQQDCCIYVARAERSECGGCDVKCQQREHGGVEWGEHVVVNPLGRPAALRLCTWCIATAAIAPSFRALAPTSPSPAIRASASVTSSRTRPSGRLERPILFALA